MMLARRVNVCTYESPLQYTDENSDVNGYSEAMFSWLESDASADFINTAPTNTVCVDFEQTTVANQGRWRAVGSVQALAEANGNAVMDCIVIDHFYEQDAGNRIALDFNTPFDLVFVGRTTVDFIGNFVMFAKWEEAGPQQGMYIMMNAQTNLVTIRMANETTAAIEVTWPANWATANHAMRITYDGSNAAAGLTLYFDRNELTPTVVQDNPDSSIDNTEIAGWGGADSLPSLFPAAASWLGYWHCFYLRTLAPGAPSNLNIAPDLWSRWFRYFSTRYAIRS